MHAFLSADTACEAVAKRACPPKAGNIREGGLKTFKHLLILRSIVSISPGVVNCFHRKDSGFPLQLGNKPL
jgi:hypothetical protein